MTYFRLGRYGDFAEAAAHFARAVDLYARALGPDHWLVANATMNYGVCLRELGSYAEAEEPLLEAHRGLSDALGEEHDRTRLARRRLHELYAAWGRLDAAGRYAAAVEPDAE